MTIQELITELDEQHRKFDKLFPAYAEALCEYENLKDARDELGDSKKEVLNKYLSMDLPEWKAQKNARDNKEYFTLLDDISNINAAVTDARKRWRKGWGIIEPIKMRIESLRTEISAMKTEIRQFGG